MATAEDVNQVKYEQLSARLVELNQQIENKEKLIKNMKNEGESEANIKYRYKQLAALLGDRYMVERDLSEAMSQIHGERVRYIISQVKNYRPPTESWVFFAIGTFLGVSLTSLARSYMTPGSREAAWNKLRKGFEKSMNESGLSSMGKIQRFVTTLRRVVWIPWTTTKPRFQEYVRDIEALMRAAIRTYACLVRKKLIESEELTELLNKDARSARRAAKPVDAADEDEKLDQNGNPAPYTIDDYEIVKKHGYSPARYAQLFGKQFVPDRLSSLTLLIRAINIKLAERADKNVTDSLTHCLEPLYVVTKQHLAHAQVSLYFMKEHRAAKKLEDAKKELNALFQTAKFEAIKYNVTNTTVKDQVQYIEVETDYNGNLTNDKAFDSKLFWKGKYN
jgi:hypothetical protein